MDNCIFPYAIDIRNILKDTKMNLLHKALTSYQENRVEKSYIEQF